jgi:tRNA(Phe) wybutosine-synthesizing methylase Tyw3
MKTLLIWQVWLGAFLHSVPMINLAGHALQSLANQSGFKKSDTLAAKQEIVHFIGKGSMHSPYFI